MRASAGTNPLFSVVVAVPTAGSPGHPILDALDAQRFPPEQVELLTVYGDGAAAWNEGLTRATGDWITFPRADDALDPDYLGEVAGFVRRRPETPLIATRRLVSSGPRETPEPPGTPTDTPTDTHRLRRHFSAGNRMRSLREWPSHFPGPSSSTFFPTASLLESQVRFEDPADDGLAGVRYLLRRPRPAVGFVTSARYLERRRGAGDGNSDATGAWLRDERSFTSRPEAYLALLRDAAGAGRAPEWLQTFVASELFGYFAAAEAHAGTGSAAVGAVGERFHRLLTEITGLLEPEVVADFSVFWTRASWRFLLAHAYRDPAWRQPYGWLDKEDRDQRLIRLRYHHTGPRPAESFSSGGREVEPAAAKTRPLCYFGRDLLWERIAWLPSTKGLRVRLDGQRLDLTVAQPERDSYSAELVRLKDALPPTAGGGGLDRRDRALLRLARSAPVRKAFADAWVLMDRVHDANDSAERLFTHLRRHRRDINAWFVIEADTPDHRRLQRRDGLRVVAHGSLTWTLLMLNARHLVSTHADVPVIAPAAITRLARPGWRFTFLGHGVNQSDLSSWLNPKPVDLFVTSSPRERDSIQGDGSGYVFTAKEVTMAGLPRLDRLRRLGRRVPRPERDLILLTPTWRHWLLAPLAAGSQRRTAYADFEHSDFARQWLGLLRSPELAVLAAEHGLTIGFLPHPNLQQVLAGTPLPAGTESLAYAGHDVQQWFARTAILITDYSSIAADLAYIDRPVVHFQFDAERFVTGDHVGRAGYFDHRRDGFGPVTETVAETVDAVAEILRTGGTPAQTYVRRAAAAFPDRDGRCCRRVIAAIEASTLPRKPVYRSAP